MLKVIKICKSTLHKQRNLPRVTRPWRQAKRRQGPIPYPPPRRHCRRWPSCWRRAPLSQRGWRFLAGRCRSSFSATLGSGHLGGGPGCRVSRCLASWWGFCWVREAWDGCCCLRLVSTAAGGAPPLGLDLEGSAMSLGDGGEYIVAWGLRHRHFVIGGGVWRHWPGGAWWRGGCSVARLDL